MEWTLSIPISQTYFQEHIEKLQETNTVLQRGESNDGGGQTFISNLENAITSFVATTQHLFLDLSNYKTRNAAEAG